MSQDRQSARSTRVLILDEDRVEGGMLAFHLRREGLVVMLMTSAEEAADAIAWAEPDVLLVEVAAQGFDGREFLSQLAHLQVDVFAVADRQLPAEVELDALRLGVIDVMMKPIDPVTLARRLKERPERKRRGSMAGLPEGGISGDLGVHSIVHLLQMAHRHRLNARIHAEIEGDWAVLLVRHGEVIDAEAPSATGREAAYQMIRATHGAFVLFPLPPEAEELSRDDVIRADLASLVGDAMGRREPRAVNVVKSREQDTFVLPHVGSPRGPLAKRGGEDTLEYVAVTQAQRAADAARVRRPGERERSDTGAPATEPRRVESTLVTARADEATAYAPPPLPATSSGVTLPAPAKLPMRHPTQPLSPPGQPPELPPEARMPEARGPTREPPRSTTNPGVPAYREPRESFESRASEQRRDVRDLPTLETKLPDGGLSGMAARMEKPTVETRSPIESPTVDEGFEESTDQKERRPRVPVLTGSNKRVASQPAMAAVSSGSGLRRVQGGSAALRSGRRGTDPEMDRLGLDGDHDAYDERPHRGGRRGSMAQRWGLGTMILAGAVAVLAIFVIARLLSREPAPPPVDMNEPTLKLGQALVDLDEGRRDQARTALATLAVDSAAPSEVLAALGRMHYQDKRLVEAEALFERLVERSPMDPEALAWLGLVQAERKDLDKARQSFAKALVGARGDLAQRLKWLVPDKQGAVNAPTPTPTAAEGDTTRLTPTAAEGDTRGATPTAAEGDTRGATPTAAEGDTTRPTPTAAEGDTTRPTLTAAEGDTTRPTPTAVVPPPSGP